MASVVALGPSTPESGPDQQPTENPVDAAPGVGDSQQDVVVEASHVQVSASVQMPVTVGNGASRPGTHGGTTHTWDGASHAISIAGDKTFAIFKTVPPPGRAVLWANLAVVRALDLIEPSKPTMTVQVASVATRWVATKWRRATSSACLPVRSLAFLSLFFVVAAVVLVAVAQAPGIKSPTLFDAGFAALLAGALTQLVDLVLIAFAAWRALRTEGAGQVWRAVGGAALGAGGRTEQASSSPPESPRRDHGVRPSTPPAPSLCRLTVALVCLGIALASAFLAVGACSAAEAIVHPPPRVLMAALGGSSGVSKSGSSSGSSGGGNEPNSTTVCSAALNYFDDWGCVLRSEECRDPVPLPPALACAATPPPTPTTTASMASTPSATPSASLSPSASQSQSQSPSTASPSQTISAQPTSLSPSSSASPSTSATQEPSASRSASGTATASGSRSPTQSRSTSATATPSQSSSASPSASFKAACNAAVDASAHQFTCALGQDPLASIYLGPSLSPSLDVTCSMCYSGFLPLYRFCFAALLLNALALLALVVSGEERGHAEGGLTLQCEQIGAFRR